MHAPPIHGALGISLHCCSSCRRLDAKELRDTAYPGVNAAIDLLINIRVDKSDDVAGFRGDGKAELRADRRAELRGLIVDNAPWILDRTSGVSLFGKTVLIAKNSPDFPR